MASLSDIKEGQKTNKGRFNKKKKENAENKQEYNYLVYLKCLQFLKWTLVSLCLLHEVKIILQNSSLFPMLLYIYRLHLFLFLNTLPPFHKYPIIDNSNIYELTLCAESGRYWFKTKSQLQN